MKPIKNRPTDAELGRVEELIEELFVGSRYSIDIRLWDDGDVHITAYSTLGTNMTDGYPPDTYQHRQVIEYEREAEMLLYRNYLKRMHPKPSCELNRIEFEVDEL